VRNALILSFSFFALALVSNAQTRQVIPTTTLQQETANNTSAPDDFAGHPNGNAAAGNVSKLPVKSLLYPGSKTKVLVALMGWWGKSSHIDMGYDSADPAQVRKQILDMKSRGFDGLTMAWYGDGATEKSNQTAHALRRELEAQGSDFTFALRPNQGIIEWHSYGMAPTDALIHHLNYAADNFFSSPAYFKIAGRPVIFEFGLEKFTIDWNRVVAEVRGNPVVIFRNANGFTKTQSSGAFAWGPADPLNYLDWFYGKAVTYPTKVTFGNASKGFDDTLASWTANRIIDQRCGQTWLGTFAHAGKYYSAANQLPFLKVSTWNDYEEGTAIEVGIDNCLEIAASAAGSVVNWSLVGTGLENTIDHYTLFVSTDGVSLMPLVDLPAGARELDVAPYNLAAGTYQVFVKAVGKPNLLNKMSNPVGLTVAAGGGSGTPANFTVALNRSEVTIHPGQSAQLQIATAANNGFTGSLSFACSGLPAAARCAFSPSSTPAGTAATLIISTGTLAAAVGGTATFYATQLLALLPFSLRRSRRMALMLMAITCVAVLTACGSGGTTSSSSQNPPQSGSASTTPPGTYTVFVTATSGATQQQVPITLVVQ
jgi:hypothetical protein